VEVGVELGDGVGELVDVAGLVGVDGRAVGSGRVSVGAGVGVGVDAGVVARGTDADVGLTWRVASTVGEGVGVGDGSGTGHVSVARKTW
jgi:hypothetical protein